MNNIKTDKLCRSCIHGYQNTGCMIKCEKCEMRDRHLKCRCFSVEVGKPCPYYRKENIAK